MGFKDETIVEEVNNNDIYHGSNKINNKYNENNRRYGSPVDSVQQQHHHQHQQHTTVAANYRSPVASYASTTSINGFQIASSDNIYPTSAETKTMSNEQQPTVEITSEAITIPLATDESTINAEPTTNVYEVERLPQPLYTRFPIRGTYTTVRNELATRIVPELNENGLGDSNDDQSITTDEVIDSIKQLQNILPSNEEDSNELRSKRILHQNDSIQNRYNLFDTLNNH